MTTRKRKYMQTGACISFMTLSCRLAYLEQCWQKSLQIKWFSLLSTSDTEFKVGTHGRQRKCQTKQKRKLQNTVLKIIITTYINNFPLLTLAVETENDLKVGEFLLLRGTTWRRAYAVYTKTTETWAGSLSISVYITLKISSFVSGINIFW